VFPNGHKRDLRNRFPLELAQHLKFALTAKQLFHLDNSIRSDIQHEYSKPSGTPPLGALGFRASRKNEAKRRG
jgi:hypothetical protein